MFETLPNPLPLNILDYSAKSWTFLGSMKNSIKREPNNHETTDKDKANLDNMIQGGEVHTPEDRKTLKRSQNVTKTI